MVNTYFSPLSSATLSFLHLVGLDVLVASKTSLELSFSAGSD